jgi:hypothetical protein
MSIFKLAFISTDFSLKIDIKRNDSNMTQNVKHKKAYYIKSPFASLKSHG